MNEFAIGIIGGTGGIGKWFADFFHGAGYEVHCVGRKTGMSLPELARRCPVIIVSVPIAATIEVIWRVGPHLPDTSLLMDFTSLKEGPVQAMREATAAEVVGCHPLFGPDCPSLAGQNIILCPGRGTRWLDRLERLFTEKGACVTRTAPQEHDRIMAIIQGLTHLDTVLMGLALRDCGLAPEATAAFSTPIFRTKQAICEKVFTARPEMYAAILAGNPDMAAIFASYENHLARMKKLCLSGDVAGLTALLRNHTLPEQKGERP